MISSLLKPTPDGDHNFLWVGVGFFSLWGGVVRYLMDSRKNNSQWSWRDVITQVVISGFTGYLGGFYGYEQNYSELMTLTIAGISGSMGGHLLSGLWNRILRKQENK